MSGAVLVTGATTPLGRALVARLLEDDDVSGVLAVGLEVDAGFEDHPRLAWHQTDLTRARAVRRLMFGPGRECATVVHAAVHRSAHAVGQKVRRLNVEATRLLLRLCEQSDAVRRFVYRSSAAVYSVRSGLPDVLREDAPLNLDPGTHQWIRDRVEADVCVSTRVGQARLEVAVLRCAELFAPDCGSQLYDYIRSPVCLRPLGFDAMLNVLSLPDAARALHLAVGSHGCGVFNIPGWDTVPLSQAIRMSGRADVPVPGVLLAPLYRWRARLRHTDFRYDLNRWRFHFSGLLDGDRARRVLGYRPTIGVSWGGAIPPMRA